MFRAERYRRGRSGRRDERGGTTAEYVGIVAFVALLVVAIITMGNTPMSESARGVISKSFCKIGSTIGVYSGCSNDDIPPYVPTECTLSSVSKDYGGSVSIIATVGGDTGYTIIRIRSRNDDGSYSDKYVVTTNGKLSGSYTFGEDASASVGTGGEEKKGGGGVKVTLDGNVQTGSSYTFDSEAEAKKFADENKAKFGIDGIISGGPEPDSTYYQIGGGGTVSGEAGPLSGEGSLSGVLGVTTTKEGDKIFKVALTAAAALDLGIPIPDSLMEASASGDASLTVTANITFDKDWNLTTVSGAVNVTAQAEGGLTLAKYERDKGKHEAKDHNSLDGFHLPTLPTLEAGMSANLTFTTDFKDDHGDYDAGQADAVGDALKDLVTGQGLDTSAKDALYNQLTNHSQITFDLSDHDEDTQSYGGKVHVWVVSVGAEYHVITTEENIINGWYLNTQSGDWEQNVACNGGA